VKQGVARAAERGISLITVHGDEAIIRAAVDGRGASKLMVFAISVLTSLDEGAIRQLGYVCPLDELVRLRARNAVACGADGLIASAQDNPNEIRRLAGSEQLLIGTPGIRPAARRSTISAGPARRATRSRAAPTISSSAARSPSTPIRQPRRRVSSRRCGRRPKGEPGGRRASRAAAGRTCG